MRPEICQTCGRLVYEASSVTLSATDYADLARKAKLYEEHFGDHPRRGCRSPIERDQDMALFILQASKTMIADEIVAECVRRFGGKRAPSRSAVYRFLDRHLNRDQAPLKAPSKSC